MAIAKRSNNAGKQVVEKSARYANKCTADLRFDGRLAKTLLSMGVPMGLQFSITAIGSIMLQSANNALGTACVAAFSAAVRIKMFFICPLESLGIAMATYCGQNYGAGKPDRVKKTIKCAMFYAEAIMLVGFLLFQFLPDKLLGLFSASEAMLAIGKPALRIICFHFLLAGMSIILSSTFQALGNGMFSLIVSICRQLVVLLPAAWLLSKTGNVNMVWWSFVIAEVVSVLMSFAFAAPKGYLMM